MAYIEKRDGYYRIRVSDGFDPITGKRRFKNFNWTPSRDMTERQISEEVNRQAVLFEEKCRRGMVLDDRVTLREFAARWRTDYAVPNLKKTTLAHYDYLLERILDALGHIRLGSITPAHINSLFEKAVKWNVLYDNPCRHVEPPKLIRHEAKFLDEEQTRQLLKELETAPYQYRVMVNLLLFTGARRGEICGLRWSDIDFDRGTVHIENNSLYLPDYGMYEDTPKTESSVRTVNVPKEIIELLREHRKHQDFDRKSMANSWTESGMIFTQVNGKPIHPTTISKWLRKFCDQRGLPRISPHTLRHTSATLLLMQGLPIKAVSGRLGHSQTATTVNLQYGHTNQSSQYSI